MILFPAIDLQNGQCVRLSRGDFQSAVLHEKDPTALARQMAEAGAEWLHIVDLDGARDQKLQQVKVIEAIARATPLRLQVGGGIRTESDIQTLLSAGADRVIVGSLAIWEPATVGNWITHLGREKIVVAMDVRLSSAGIPEVMTHGWQRGSALALWDVLTAYKGSGLRTILCTDSQRDGGLMGANRLLYSQIRQIWADLNVIASGGVSDIEDLKALDALGLHGAVVGKAFHEGKMDVREAIAALRP